MTRTTATDRRQAELTADLRWTGTAELHALIEVYQYALAGAGTEHDAQAAEVVRHLYEGDLRLAEAELARRMRLHAAGKPVADPHDADYLVWRDLARQVREEADIVAVLLGAGCALRRAGREWAGPCPHCGGSDRFRVWSAADGKRPGFWCRQCGFSGDVITAYRQLAAPDSSFFQAVRSLAAGLGRPAPEPGGMPGVAAGGRWPAGAPRPQPRTHDSPQHSRPGSDRGTNRPRPPAIHFEQGQAVSR